MRLMYSLTSVVLAAAFIAGSASAVVVLDTDFTEAEGFSTGNLKFQQGWLGQDPPQVDPTGTGVVVSSGAFIRNLYSVGATGTTAETANDGAGAGFAVGDMFQIDVKKQYTLSSPVNADMGIFGVRDNFSTGGFNATPTMGVKVNYNQFDPATGGSIKFWTNLARGGGGPADNPFALFVSGDDVGLNPTPDVGEIQDLISDLLLISVKFTKTSATEWTASELVITNLDTATELARATTDKPGVLETVTYADDEAYYADRWTDNAAVTTTTDSVRFEYIPIPEPASLALVGAGALILGVRSRPGS